MIRQCLECGAEYVAQRRDRMFCTQVCSKRNHERRTRAANAEMRRKANERLAAWERKKAR